MICLEAKQQVKEPVDQNLYLFCEVCFEKIGLVDKDTLFKPMKGSMFKTFDPVHGRPAPFRPEADWLDLKCPYCRRRAMYEPDSITTQHGKLKVYTQRQKEALDTRLAIVEQKKNEIVEYVDIGQDEVLKEGDEVFFHEIPAKYIKPCKKKADKGFVVIEYEDGKRNNVKPSMLKKKYVYTAPSKDDTSE